MANYTITFKDINEQTCIVTIGGTGVATDTALTPADSPFSTTESKPKDVFEPIIGQTGYIRVVDCGEDVISNLIPSSAISHPVTLTVAGVLKWVGYIAPDAFEQEWGSATSIVPTELEIPVISPLTALDYIKYPGDVNNAPDLSLKMVADIIIKCFDQVFLSAWDTQVFYPRTNNDDVWTNVRWGGLNTYVYNNNFADYNEDKNKWEWRTCGDVVASISQFYGWSWREWEGNIMFTIPDLETPESDPSSALYQHIRHSDYSLLNYPTTSGYKTRYESDLANGINYDGEGHSVSVLQGKNDIKLTANVNVGEDAIDIPDFKDKLTFGTSGAIDNGETGIEKTVYKFRSWQGNSYITAFCYAGRSTTPSQVSSVDLWADYRSGTGTHYNGGCLVTSGEGKVKDGLSIEDRMLLSPYLYRYPFKDMVSQRKAFEIKSKFPVYNTKDAYLIISGDIKYYSNHQNMEIGTIDDGNNVNRCLFVNIQMKDENGNIKELASSVTYGYAWADRGDQDRIIPIRVRGGRLKNYNEDDVLNLIGKENNWYRNFFVKMPTYTGTNTPFHGELQIRIYTQNSITQSGCPPEEEFWIISGFNATIETVEPLDVPNKYINEKKFVYEYENENGNLYLDDISTSFDLCTNRSRWNGLGVIRQADGSPITKNETIYTSQTTLKYYEEYLLDRYKNYFGSTRRMLTIESEYDGRMNPYARISETASGGRIYMPIGHEIDWKQQHDIINLIEIDNE